MSSAIALLGLVILLACGFFVVEGLRLWELGLRIFFMGRRADALAARTLSEDDIRPATPSQKALYRCLSPQEAFARWIADGKPSLPWSLSQRILFRAADRRRARAVTS